MTIIYTTLYVLSDHFLRWFTVTSIIRKTLNKNHTFFSWKEFKLILKDEETFILLNLIHSLLQINEIS